MYLIKLPMKTKKKKKLAIGSGGIRTHASEETGT